MTKKIFGDEKINILLICLESLDLYSTDIMYQSISKELYTKKEKLNLYQRHCTTSKSTYSIKKTLYLLYTINNMILEKHLQKKVNIILSDYSSFYPISVENFSLTTIQYLNRFVYKYQVFHRYKLTKKINKIKESPHKLYNIAIINLYILNKILSKEGPYIMYKYLYIS